MTRCHFRYNVLMDGKPVQNAKVKVYSYPSLLPATDMFNAQTGGVGLVDLSSNNQGEVEAWFDNPKTVQLEIEDNNDTAYLAASPTTRLTWNPFTELVEITPAPNDIARLTDLTTIISAHEALSDPHPQYNSDESLTTMGVIPTGLIGNGIADDRQAILDANNAAATSGIVYLPPGRFSIASNLTLTARFWFSRGAILKPAAGVTITIAEGFDAGAYQIFDTSVGTVTITAALPEAYIEWWDNTAGTNYGAAMRASQTYIGFFRLLPKTYPFTGSWKPGYGSACSGVKGKTFLLCSDAAAVLSLGDTLTAWRYGRWSGITILGNSIANVGLFCGVGDGYTIDDFRVQDAKRNVVLEACQNSNISVDSVGPAGFTDYCVVVDKGCANLKLRGSWNSGQIACYYQTQSAPTPVIGPVPSPDKIHIENAVVEGSPLNQYKIEAGTVYINNGSCSSHTANPPILLRKIAKPGVPTQGLFTTVSLRDLNVNYGEYSIDAQGLLAGVTGGGITLNVRAGTTLGTYNLVTAAYGTAGIKADDGVVINWDIMAALGATPPTKTVEMIAGSALRAIDILIPSTGFRSVRSTANETRTDSTLALTTSGLKLRALSRGYYKIELMLIVTGQTAADIQLRPTAPSCSGAVTNKALTSNVATLTTAEVNNGLYKGDEVTVAISDATFDGTYTVTAATATTFSYAKTAANVASTAAAGTYTGPIFKINYLNFAPYHTAATGLAIESVNFNNQVASVAATGGLATGLTHNLQISGKLYVPKPGDVTFLWAQRTTDAIPTTILPDSELTLFNLFSPDLALQQ